MPNHFGARVAISRLQRLKTHTPSHPGRCPGLLHFAPLALGTQVLTQTFQGRARALETLSRSDDRTERQSQASLCDAKTSWTFPGLEGPG